MLKKIKKTFSGIVPKRSIARRDMDDILFRLFERVIPGNVLDIGAETSPYKNRIPYTKYLRMDINRKNLPDIVSDIHNIKAKRNSFDIIIATEVLEHVKDPHKATKELYRVLKPGGTCILSTRFCYRYHPNPEDHYRFTKDSLSFLFRKYRKVDIYPHGNRIHLIWHILNRRNPLLQIFTPLIAKVKFKDESFPMGFVVYAKK